MALTLVDFISEALGIPRRGVWRRWRQHHHHPRSSANPINDVGLRTVLLTFMPHGATIMNVTGSFTAPTTRKSGASLPLADIDHFSLQRNGVEIQTLAPSGPTISWTDATPLTGTDTYEVFTITKDGFISLPSNDAVVAVATADPAVAVTDLTATLNP